MKQLLKEGRFKEFFGKIFGSAYAYVTRKLKEFWGGLQSDHAIISFLYPNEEETSVLTDPQVAQIFW